MRSETGRENGVRAWEGAPGDRAPVWCLAGPALPQFPSPAHCLPWNCFLPSSTDPGQLRAQLPSRLGPLGSLLTSDFPFLPVQALGPVAALIWPPEFWVVIVRPPVVPLESPDLSDHNFLSPRSLAWSLRRAWAQDFSRLQLWNLMAAAPPSCPSSCKSCASSYYSALRPLQTAPALAFPESFPAGAR